MACYIIIGVWWEEMNININVMTIVYLRTRTICHISDRTNIVCHLKDLRWDNFREDVVRSIIFNVKRCCLRNGPYFAIFYKRIITSKLLPSLIHTYVTHIEN